MSIKINYSDYYNAVYGDKDKQKEEKKVDGAKAELVEKLNKIDEEYNNTTTRTYGDKVFDKLVDKTYDPLSDEEIEKIAKENISEDEWRNKAKKLESDAKEKKDDLKKRGEELTKKAAESLETLDERAAEAKREVENQALKRGLGRSSVIAEELSEMEEAKIKAGAEILNSELVGLNGIDEKIASLEENLKESFDNLEIKKAAEIAKNIQALKDERQAKIDEVEKYNAKQREERQKELTKLENNGVDVSEEGTKEYIARTGSMIRELYSYYRSLGKDATKEISNDKDFIEERIGSDGYKYLKSFF